MRGGRLLAYAPAAAALRQQYRTVVETV